jgi:hypothetical protein
LVSLVDFETLLIPLARSQSTAFCKSPWTVGFNKAFLQSINGAPDNSRSFLTLAADATSALAADIPRVNIDVEILGEATILWWNCCGIELIDDKWTFRKEKVVVINDNTRNKCNMKAINDKGVENEDIEEVKEDLKSISVY